MQRVFDAFFELPEYVAELLTGPFLIWVVLALFVFLIAMFFNGKIAHILRQICILALAVGAVIAYFKRQYRLFWLLLLSLIVLLVYRLLVYFFVTMRQNSINRRIEKRALEKAKMRRGAHKRDFGETPASSLENAEPDQKSGTVSGMESGQESGTEAPQEEASSSLSRAQLFDSIKKLEDLKDTGVLTEEEFNQKKAELYSRLG